MHIQLKRLNFPNRGRPFFSQELLSVHTPSSLRITFFRKLSLILLAWATWPPFVLPPSGIHSAVKGFLQKTMFYISLFHCIACSLNAELMYYLLLNFSYILYCEVFVLISKSCWLYSLFLYKVFMYLCHKNIKLENWTKPGGADM